MKPPPTTTLAVLGGAAAVAAIAWLRRERGNADAASPLPPVDGPLGGFVRGTLAGLSLGDLKRLLGEPDASTASTREWRLGDHAALRVDADADHVRDAALHAADDS